MTRFTIPLGALEKALASKWEQSNDPSYSDIYYKGHPWFVSLHTKSKVILSEEHDDFLVKTTRSASVQDTFLPFDDELIARRVQAAFNHAADLFRGKEPF